MMVTQAAGGIQNQLNSNKHKKVINVSRFLKNVFLPEKIKTNIIHKNVC